MVNYKMLIVGLLALAALGGIGRNAIAQETFYYR